MVKFKGVVLKSRLISLFAVLFYLSFSFSFVFADQGLVFDIDTDVNDLTNTIYLRTEESSSTGWDTSDSLIPVDPNFTSSFYSLLADTKKLIVDSWDAKINSSRVLNLVFNASASSNYTGTLALSWDSSDLDDDDGRYSFTLNDYGDDSSRNTLNDSKDMNSFLSYSVANTFVSRYFSIETNYNYCGDSTCDSWETCTSCSGDCGACSAPTGGDTGGGGSTGGGGGPSGEEAEEPAEPLIGPPVYEECIDSCSSLGYSCGTQTICGQLVSCGSCGAGEDCFLKQCVALVQDPESEEELAIIPTEVFKELFKDSLTSQTSGETDCSPKYSCSAWSECKVSYDTSSLLNGAGWFSGERQRFCSDSNGCSRSIQDSEGCSLKVEIYTEETQLCGQTYIQVYDKTTNELLTRVQKDSGILGSMKIFLLPGEVNCEVPSDEEFSLNFLDQVGFFIDFRHIWRLVL